MVYSSTNSLIRGMYLLGLRPREDRQSDCRALGGQCLFAGHPQFSSLSVSSEDQSSVDLAWFGISMPRLKLAFSNTDRKKKGRLL